MTATILALDASSTTIGWALYESGAIVKSGQITLYSRDINDRCKQANWEIGVLIANHGAIDVVAIESPVARFAKAVIPQALVSGAIRVAARFHDRHVVDVTPAEAKQALTGRGNADKALMQTMAGALGVTGEHAADAVGVALAAVGKVRVTR